MGATEVSAMVPDNRPKKNVPRKRSEKRRWGQDTRGERCKFIPLMDFLFCLFYGFLVDWRNEFEVMWTNRSYDWLGADMSKWKELRHNSQLLVLTRKKKTLSSTQVWLRLSRVSTFPAWKSDLSTWGHSLPPPIICGQTEDTSIKYIP